MGSRNAQPEDFREGIKLLETSLFPVDAAVSMIVPLEEAANALSSWSQNPSDSKKSLVCWD